MKVKYSNQLAFPIIEEGVDITGVTGYMDLSSFFPTLDASDAILVKRVMFNLSAGSIDAGLAE